MKYILVIIATLSISLGHSQSKVVEDFQAAHKGQGYKLFLYQSYIRMLNQDNNDDFNQLVKDLDHIKVITTDSSLVEARKEYKELRKKIASEGFEELLMIDNKEMKVCLYENTSGAEKQFVAFFFSSKLSRTGLLEMNGELDLKYMSAFESLDFKKLKEIAESQN